jgi:aminoglycoside phosphotransferase (APT) family kinase protein
MSVGVPGATTAARPPLEEVLSGRLGAGAVRRVALEPYRFGLAPLLDGTGNGPGPLRLVRSKYKPSRLSGWYILTPGDGGAPRRLAVTWSADGGVALRVYPDDPSMPQLARLSSPDHVAGMLRRLDGVRDDPRWRPEVQPVRYRPGQRHVLRVRCGPDGRGYYLKTDRDANGGVAVEAARVVGALLADRCPAVRVAEAVGTVDEDRTAVWREAEGSPLSHRLVSRAPTSEAPLRLLGRALRELHDGDLAMPWAVAPGPADPRRRNPASEVAVTLRAGAHIAALLPTLGARYRELAQEAGECLELMPGEPAGLVHGDAKCDNVLVVGDARLRVLDLDRCARADPALDLGKLLADLRWWCPDDRRAARWSEALAQGYGADPPQRWARARAWAALLQLRNAARRCAVHDPAWTQQVCARVAGAAAALHAGGDRP